MRKIYTIYDYAMLSTRGYFSSKKKAEEELIKLQEACRNINEISSIPSLWIPANPRFTIKTYELNKIE